MSDLDMTPGARRAVAALFVVVLAFGAVNVLFTAREVGAVRGADARAAHNAVTITQFCQAVNGINSKQPVLWGHLVTVAAPPPHETPRARRARLALTRTFIAYVGRLFAPIHCQAPLTTRSTP